MNHRIPATIVNHVEIDIAVPADVVWGVIIDQIAEAKGFRLVGKVTSIDDPAIPLGGYHMLLDGEDGEVDERVAHITERDEAARRLSIAAEFRSVPGGMRVYATYQAHDIAIGARFTVDCHTLLEIDVPTDAVHADVAAAVTAQTTSYHEALMGNLRATKERLENDA